MILLIPMPLGRLGTSVPPGVKYKKKKKLPHDGPVPSLGFWMRLRYC